jgi:anti-sigma B factor antagonist
MDTPSTSPFLVHVRSDGDALHLGLVGEFDLSEVDCFRACVEGAVESNGGSVVIDLGDVTFIDSTAITALLEVRRRCDGDGRQLRFENASASVTRVFELTGLTEVFMDGDVAPA